MKLPDPWSTMARPASGYAARRVEASHPADLFWARDVQGRQALLLRYDPAAATSEPRPALQGVEVLEPDEHEGKLTLVLLLHSAEDVEIFHRLCSDIVEATAALAGDAAIVRAFLRRMWKWHRLLRGGVDRRLGPLDQQGLIGELLILERLLAQRPAVSTITAWRGPLDEPKDFVLGLRSLEIKTRSLARNAVRISSEHQLQTSHGEEVFLIVTSISSADRTTPNAFTLDDLVSRLMVSLAADPAAQALLDSRLVSAGYLDDDDYSDFNWVTGGTVGYQVSGAFPRIEASALPPGLGAVAYTLHLDTCAPFEAPLTAILEEDVA